MEITPEWAEGHWPQLVADAGLTLDRTQLVIVRDARPNGRTDCAYCQPTFLRQLNDPEVYLVVRRIGDRAFRQHHVVAVWQELPDRDEVATLALLRHELEHAAQWERWGQGVVDEVDPELKALTGRDGEAYHGAPIERAADDAARTWVTEHLGAAEARRLSQDAFPYWQNVPNGARSGDLRVETIAALRAAAPEGHHVLIANAPAVSLEDFIAEHEQEEAPLAAGARQDAPSIEFID